MTKLVQQVQQVLIQVNEAQASFTGLFNKWSGINTILKTHEARFTAIHPLLLPMRDLKRQVGEIEITIQQGSTKAGTSAQSVDPWLQNSAPLHGSGPFSPNQNSTQPAVVSPRLTTIDANDAEARIRTMEHLLKSLEKRIVGYGVRIGFLFQSKEDLRLWLAAHIPSNRFSLFVDRVSIFDFLAQPHMDSSENMAHLYNSQKNGFETIYESRVISSIQNLFPDLFGKNSADGMDTSQTLPALQSIDKWNYNGVTGLQLQVERELPNVDLQFRNAIASTFDNSPEARNLALELLYHSKKFALDLCNFMQCDFDFWKNKGYSKTEAWYLTCLSVRRIFEDLHVIRVVGRDSRDLKNPALTTTQILWATFCSHIVMEEYSRRNFFEHPSISAVIARHLASHHTRPDSTLESKFKKLEKKFNKLSNKVNSLESRLARVESKNDLTPPHCGRGGGKIKDKDGIEKDRDASPRGD